MHRVRIYCIVAVAARKTHTERNHISPISRPNPIVWTNQSDRLPRICGRRLPLFREREREQIGNGQFLFPDCLIKKKRKKTEDWRIRSSFSIFPETKECYQRILHVPPPVMRFSRNDAEHRSGIKRNCDWKSVRTRVPRVIKRRLHSRGNKYAITRPCFGHVRAKRETSASFPRFGK